MTHHSLTLAKTQERLICARLSVCSCWVKRHLASCWERSSPEFAKLLAVGLGPLVSVIGGLVVDVRRGSGIVIRVFFHHLQLGFDGTNLCINTLNSRGNRKGNLLIQSKWVTY